MIVLICGISGSGKTTLSYEIGKHLPCQHLNADALRTSYDDWDFSHAGRMRQARRMHDLSEDPQTIYICDFICPTEEFRSILQPDIIIWMDTETSSMYEDTDRIFEKPQADIIFTEKNLIENRKIAISFIAKKYKTLYPEWNNCLPTVQMLGRFDPWHDGHMWLFDQALAQT